MPDALPIPAGTLVVLYDGVCGFCNGVVRFILKRDRGRVFRYASLQSGFAKEVLGRHDLILTSADTMYLVSGYGTPDERLAMKSTAALTIFGHLGTPWSWFRVLLLLPRFVRDGGYDLVARVRYRVFGKHDHCPLPAPEWRERFIEV